MSRRKSQMTFQGRTAVVTGAASGIGRALAAGLAIRGCHLALVDRDVKGLAETLEQLSGTKVRCTLHELDVTDKAGLAALPAEVLAAHDLDQAVDFLFNNAGVALGGKFEQVSAEDFEWLFEINFWAVVRLTRLFLPLLRASDDARVVNISSLFGIVAPPLSVPYVASKFAVRGFSMSLGHELEGSSVGVTVIHPGGVATEIAKSAKLPSSVSSEEADQQRLGMDQMLTLPPSEAATIILDGVARRQARVLVGRDARLGALVERLLPTLYWPLMKLGIKYAPGERYERLRKALSD